MDGVIDQSGDLATDEKMPQISAGHGGASKASTFRIERSAVGFPSEQALRDAIERVLAPLGRRVDELSPMVDARLADGSRVNAIIPPLAIDGPLMSIRRFSQDKLMGADLVERKAMTRGMIEKVAYLIRIDS